MAVNILFKPNATIAQPEIEPHKTMSRNCIHMDLQDATTTDYLSLPISTTGSYARTDAAGITDWTVAHTDINAACDVWSGLLWLDTVNKKLFVVATDTLPAPNEHFLASINLATGAVTNIGSFDDNEFQHNANLMGTERATTDSGNFFCTTFGNRYEINSTTGALVSNTTPVIDGITAEGGNTTGILAPSGKYYIRGLTVNDNIPVMYIDRGGYGTSLTEVIVPFPAGYHAATGIVGAKCVYWGDGVAIVTHVTTAATFTGPRYFDKTDFFRYCDEWLGIK